MGILGCLLAFGLVIYLVYKNWSVLIAALLGTLVCVVTNGLPVWDTITGIYLH